MIEGAVQFIAYVCGLVEYLVAEFTGFTEFTEFLDRASNSQNCVPPPRTALALRKRATGILPGRSLRGDDGRECLSSGFGVPFEWDCSGWTERY